jgi:hypothetical protein
MLKTQNTILFSQMSEYTQEHIYASINRALDIQFNSFDEFKQSSALSMLLEQSSAFSTALSYVYTVTHRKIQEYLDPKSKLYNPDRAAFMTAYLQHRLFFSAVPNCPSGWSLDQYTRMCSAMRNYFDRLFQREITVL